jgi:uncharacterized membrane protein
VNERALATFSASILSLLSTLHKGELAGAGAVPLFKHSRQEARRRIPLSSTSRQSPEALDRRTTTERASNSIVKLVGSIRFLLLQVVPVTAWIAVNLNAVPGLKPFDPFPFGILALVGFL